MICSHLVVLPNYRNTALPRAILTALPKYSKIGRSGLSKQVNTALPKYRMRYLLQSVKRYMPK